eukprot:Gb_23528 [translate_table: standard]
MSNQNAQQALALPEKEVMTSGMANNHSVTGGVYKARERIHCRMDDRRLLAILASCIHAPPVSMFPKALLSFKRIHGIPSPGGILNTLATTLHRSIRTMLSIHRLQLGLLGYLIPFTPLAFISQCQCQPNRVLLPLVFFPISTHFTAPSKIPSSPTVLQLGSFCHLSRIPSLLLLREKKFMTHGPSTFAWHCSVRLSPIAKNSPLLPPIGVWAVSQSSVADHPLRRATDRHLGKPLPHQLANQTQAPPWEDSSFCSSAYGVLATVSSCCSPPKGKFLRVTHSSATGNTTSRPTCMC